jgi:uncharacterized protein (DUF1684 family)
MLNLKQRLFTRFLFLLCCALTGISGGSQAQNTQAYKDSLQAFRENYINTHEVVKTKEDRALLKFYPIDPSYNIPCYFKKSFDSDWFSMNTSGASKQIYRVYGRLTFTLHDTVVHLLVYQSQSLMNTKDYKDYLFIPFTDNTSAIETYGAGRYLECYITDIHNGVLLLDFNKAYNPYCAYSSGYNCPIPPKENALLISVRAGEKIYGKQYH